MEKEKQGRQVEPLITIKNHKTEIQEEEVTSQHEDGRFEVEMEKMQGQLDGLQFAPTDLTKKVSPLKEESVYYDALADGMTSGFQQDGNNFECAPSSGKGRATENGLDISSPPRTNDFQQSAPGHGSTNPFGNNFPSPASSCASPSFDTFPASSKSQLPNNVRPPGHGSTNPFGNNFPSPASSCASPSFDTSPAREHPFLDPSPHNPSSGIVSSDAFSMGTCPRRKPQSRKEKAKFPLFQPRAKARQGQEANTGQGLSNEMSSTSLNGFQKIDSMHFSAQEFFKTNDYPSSICLWTTALNELRVNNRSILTSYHNYGALFIHRAAALISVRAFTASWVDCDWAWIVYNGGGKLTHDDLLSLLKSCLALGRSREACQTLQHNVVIPQELQSDINTANALRERILKELSELNQLSQEKLEALSASIDKVINFESACMDWNCRKIQVLAALKEWQELVWYCEHLAVENTKYAVFFVDNPSFHPFPGASPATTLKPAFYEQNEKGLLTSKQAVQEVLCWLPQAMLPYYLTALRVEERYDLANAALSFLKNTNLIMPSALIREDQSLQQMIELRNEGNKMFETEDYKGGLEAYLKCLNVDDNRGGKVHAVLYCNIALCYKCMGNVEKALENNSEAIQIHSHYMTAIRRRNGCYKELGLFDEAIAGYEHYIELVTSSREDGAANKSTKYQFDGPNKVTDKKLNEAKEALTSVRQKKEHQESKIEAQHLNSTNHYTILQVSQVASDSDIKKAYHRLARKYHPDKDKRENAKDSFLKIKLAYEVLIDGGARRQYDASINFDTCC